MLWSATLSSTTDWLEIAVAIVVLSGVIWGVARRLRRLLVQALSATLREDIQKEVGVPLDEVRAQVTPNGGTTATLGDAAVRIEELCRQAVSTATSAQREAEAARRSVGGLRDQFIEHLEHHGQAVANRGPL